MSDPRTKRWGITAEEQLERMVARIEHLSQLRQPGPVDLGPEDNERAQDDLFAELEALESRLWEFHMESDPDA